MGYPTDLRYTENHHWVRVDENVVTVGLTEVAADALGAIGFVELPYPSELFGPGDVLGRISSDTAAAAIYMPVFGRINVVNLKLSESPGLVNSDPYGEGWLVRMQAGDPADVDDLMDAAGYEAFLSTKSE